ncbi:MAG: GAF domain-containing sensor histidine kinase [Chloroflexota bacterium]
MTEIKSDRSGFLIVDEMVCRLRWLPLALAPVLAFVGTYAQQQVDLTLVIVLAALGLAYNAVAVLLLRLQAFPAAAAWLFFILDVFLSIGFLVATNFSLCSLATFGLFTVLEAALRFEWVVGIVAGVVIAFASGLGITILAEQTSLSTLWPAMVGLATLLLSAAVSGLLADAIRQMVVRARDKELNDLRRTNERAQAIYEMASTLSATLDYQRAMEAILDISLMGLEELDAPDKTPVVMLLLYGGEGMYVTTARHMKREDMGRVIPGQQGLIAKVLSSGEPAIVRNLFRDPELSRFVSLQSCRSAIVVPLRVGFDIYGAVVIASDQPEAFTEEHKELVTSVCTQAVMALQNAQLYQDLREERDKIIDQHEEARAQLARDLHDGPTQSISAIAMRLNYVKALMHRNPPQARKELDDLEALARRTTREIRTMLFTLRPQVLETQGLVVAVEQYVAKVQEDVDFAIHLEAMDLGDALDINTQTVAFNIIEESMNNIKKHAQCRNVWIRLALQNHLFVCEVRDDGKGFDLEATMRSYDQRGSLGLLNLYERAELVEGKTEIRSALGKGTTITMVVPLNK